MSAENHTRDASLLESYFFDWLLLNFYSSFNTFLLAKWEMRLKQAIYESTRAPLFSHCQSEYMHVWKKNNDGQSLPRVGKVASGASRIGF